MKRVLLLLSLSACHKDYSAVPPLPLRVYLRCSPGNCLEGDFRKGCEGRPWKKIESSIDSEGFENSVIECEFP